MKQTSREKLRIEVETYRENFHQDIEIMDFEKWANDGISKTVLGYKTEMDGRGQHNEPSWMLAMGLI